MTPFELVDAAARRHPERTALVVGGTAFTYARLRRAVERTAAELVGAHGRPPRTVGLLAARQPLAYLGYLAALRLGATVVPLNPAFPDSRNATTSRLARLDVVVVQDGAQPPPGPWTVLRQGEAVQPGPVPPYAGLPDDTAYVLFTSGSTGAPKGVPITNRNLSAYLEHNLARYRLGPGCLLSQTFDLTFDPSVFDMFLAWSSGATLVVPSREEVFDPVGFVSARGITHWFSVPSVISLARRMRRLPEGAMPSLRLSLFAGEQLTLQQARAWRAAAPGSAVENIYGPTELTITCTGYRLPENADHWPSTANQTVPIGWAYPHLEHVVLGEDGRPANEGELCVRGPQRFAGYLDPADNAGRFLAWEPGAVARVHEGGRAVTTEHWYRTGDRVRADDEHGLLHMGRLDSQVKIHGYRVELGEIEALLREHPVVEDAVVVFDGDSDLRAVYTGQRVPPGQLAELVGARLPRYMVPREYRWISELPLNGNGKVDRKRLARSR
ncbi:AMP-binding protein [Saccharothrix coeruleofusca]|uniref:Amino acid adenylation protein n=1 Tax=Saccharothrix coeruleofusca TaxID=33919 RepID=A0A918ASN3_9PSEU|nr:AMP-binding protein [Saccharothrix coeruleofusca]MBP2336702.1 amino acid adenylation domain-containing protein [Saccharothrix coeruleofusca]GGP78634.1 amino acid adenylation protein [Saccharothrix coeruleofusca]